MQVNRTITGALAALKSAAAARMLAMTVSFLLATVSYAQSPRQIVNYLTQRQAMVEVTPDSIFPTIRHLETMRAEARDSVTWAMLSECLGELYSAGAGSLAFHGQQGETLEEWGFAQWRSAADACFADARRPIRALHRAKAKSWRPLLQLPEMNKRKAGGNCREWLRYDAFFGGDLLHCLLYRHGDANIVDYYVKQVGGDASVMAQLQGLTAYADVVEVADDEYGDFDIDLATDRYAQLLRRAEADRRVSDRARVSVYMALANSASGNDEKCVAICKEGIAKYPKEPLTNELRNIMLNQSHPYCNARFQTVVYPGATYPVELRYRNVRAVEITYGDQVVNYATHHDSPYTHHTDTLQLTMPAKAGTYRMSVKPLLAGAEGSGDVEQRVDSFVFYVSPYTVLGFNRAETGGYQFAVVDAMSGRRDPTREVTVFDTVISRYRGAERYVRIVGDPQPAVALYRVNQYRLDTSAVRTVNVFTDRAIYRPGQTVQLSAVAHTRKHWTTAADAGLRLPVTVRDNNYDIIFTDTVTTDEFGVVSTCMQLPATTPLGHYSVRVGNGSASFRVEEYKRPTFEVLFADSLVRIDSSTVRLDFTARMFNGQPLRRAAVEGSVRASFWWRYKDVNVEIDSMVTDSQGQGSIVVPLPLRDERVPAYVSASLKVTAASGETVSATHGYRYDYGGDNTRGLAEQRDPVWFSCDDDTIHADRPATIQVGSSVGDIYLYYIVERGDTCVAFVERHLTDSLTTITFDDSWLRDNEADGISVALAVVKDENYYLQEYSLKRPLPATTLQWHWDTFRDRVTPGTDEQWTGTLLTPDGRPADANAMFTVYDASLDQFVNHRWRLAVSLPHAISQAFVLHFSPKSRHQLAFNRRLPLFDVPCMAFYQFNPVLSSLLPTHRRYLKSALKANSRVEMVDDCLAEAPCYAMPVAGAANLSEPEAEVADDMQADEPEDTPIVGTLRTNFNETACFVSTLRTDKHGRLALRFTLPDCVTTWQLFGVAHTRDMMTANISALSVAQKEFMAMVNLPRFARMGDIATGTVTLQNVSGTTHQVQLRVDVTDAASEQVVATYNERLTLCGDTVIPFRFAADRPQLVIKAIATDGRNSDGEQHLLNVLDDSEWVARSTDLQCMGAGNHVFALDTLFAAGALDRRTTVQYTEHPIWTAVDVLRTIRVPEHDDVISLHTALYANTLLAYLAEHYDEVGDYLQLSPDTLATTVSDLVQRLSRLRNADGGYGWFGGHQSSPWMTLEVATTFARLHAMIGGDDDSSSSVLDEDFSGLVALDQTLAFLRSEAAERVKFMREHDYKQASATDLQYLYVLALLGQPIGDDERYLLDLLMAQRDQLSREELAILTVTLSTPSPVGQGRAAEAEATGLRLRHFIVRDDRQGAFFSYLRGPFTSIDRKLLDHVYAMEAVRAQPEDGDATLLADMRRWLLQQKRVQAWKNPLHNASSVYALLLGNAYDLSGEARDVLTLDGTLTLPVTNGQVKQTLLEDKQAHSTITVEKHSEGESWGAVYVEDRLPIDEIRSATNGLAIRAYVEAASASKASVDGADRGGATLTVGDDAHIRLVITADRDYECVHVAVPRPACLEPANLLSANHYQGGLFYYQEVHDNRDDIFIEQLPKGNYVIAIPAYAVHTGTYNTGITRIECLYAPEYCGNTDNKTVTVGKE